MSKRYLTVKRLLHSLQHTNEKLNWGNILLLNMCFSYKDTEGLVGYPEFLSAIHEIAPDVPDMEWSEYQIQRACEISGMSRRSIITDNPTREKFTIQIQNRR